MVAVVQLAEHRIVAPGVVGSNPISHPIFLQGNRMNIHRISFDQLSDSFLAIPETIREHLVSTFAKRDRKPDFYLTGDAGFFMLPQRGSKIYFLLYFLRELQRSEVGEIVSHLCGLLQEIEYKWITVMYRFDSPTRHQLFLFAEFFDIENSSSRFEMTAPDQELVIEPDDFTWNRIMPDEDALLKFHLDIYPDDPEYMEPTWDYLIPHFLSSESNPSCINCYDGDTLAGCLLSLDENNYVYLYNIGTLPEYQRRGIATGLLKRFINTHPGRNLQLNVFSHTPNAARLYRRFGFEETLKTQLIARKFSD